MANITRKNITFKVSYNEVDYNVFIPFLSYNMFKEIHLVFGYFYKLIADNKIEPMTFCVDLEAYFDLAIEQSYPNSDKKAKLDSLNEFFKQSFLGAYIYDTKNNYEAIFLDQFILRMSETERDDFLSEIKGFYCFFYVTQRYLKAKAESVFKDSYISLNAMELKDSFTKSLYQETFTETSQKQIEIKTL